MKKVLFYGNFGIEGETITNGQTSKITNFYNLFRKVFPSTSVNIFNTQFFKKNVFKNLIHLKKEIKKADFIIIFPGGVSSLKVILRLLHNKDKIVFYPVVGGWLADCIKTKKWIIDELKKIKCIYPETLGLKNKLESLGISNTKLSPVFTCRKRISFDEILNNYKTSKGETIKFVYFGRISEKKGIYIAINAANELVEKYKLKCSLDFYGQLQSGEDFSRFYSSLSENIRYKGILSDEDIKRLGDYDFCLFPTFYEGEGFPAVCVESLTFGTPIIASDWKYNSEIIKIGFNGFLFSLEYNNIVDILIKTINEYNIIQLKKNAYDSSLEFLPEKAIKPFVDDMRSVLEDD